MLDTLNVICSYGDVPMQAFTVYNALSWKFKKETLCGVETLVCLVSYNDVTMRRIRNKTFS